jgi:thiamine pyrophosphate-dependent acetolactate synthase large subunit-like protein
LPLAEDAQLAQVGTGVLGARAWAADLQRLDRADLVALASPSSFLAAMRREIESRDLPATAHRHRHAAIAARAAEARASWEREARATAAAGGISQANLAIATWDAVREHDPVLANGSLSDWALRTWELNSPFSYLGCSGGAGLGYGLGASIGAALAHRTGERLVVDLQSDGDLLMTPSALWTAAHERLPLLIVMDNNRAYANSVHHARRIAAARSRDVGRAHVATTLTEPAIDFAAMAESMGVRGFGPITERDALPDVLALAVRLVVSERRPVLVDVVTTEPGGDR